MRIVLGEQWEYSGFFFKEFSILCKSDVKNILKYIFGRHAELPRQKNVWMSAVYSEMHQLLRWIDGVDGRNQKGGHVIEQVQ